MRILYLINSVGLNGASEQLALLAPPLQQAGHHIEVCQFRGESEQSACLREFGLRVHSLPGRHRLDPIPLWQLHGILGEFRPDLVHVWGLPLLRTLALVGIKHLKRAVLSQPFSWRQRVQLSAFDRWLLGKTGRVIVQTEAEARLATKQGVFLDKLAIVPPGVQFEAVAQKHQDLAEGCRKIVCVGPFERYKGYRDAIWAFDMVRFLYDDVRLVLAGNGPDRPGLEKMARDIECEDAVHFVEPGANIGELLAGAEVCWIPSRRGGGTQVALEAMRAGRPVIACQVPSLHGLIVDGESGFVVAPGDKLAFARRTRQILLDADLAGRLGAQARLRVQQHFSAPVFVERFRSTYLQVA